MNKPLDAYHHYVGIIHVHSTYSDGTRTIPEIAAVANELDIDYLLLTDHNTLQPKFEGLQGWYKKLLVGIGTELNDADDLNHYLAFDIDEELDQSLPPHDYVCRVRELGGFGIIAHPDEKRTHIPKYPAYPWTIWNSDCFDGIEIWNQMSEWMEGLTHFNKYYRVLHPRRSIVAPQIETLGRWDAVNMKRRVVGIGGVDAHEYRYKLLGFLSFRVFRYKISFRTIRTHILTEKTLSGEDKHHEADLQTVYRALLSAHCFISHRYLGDANAFRFWSENEHGLAIIGGELPYSPRTRLYVKNPCPVQSVLIHNGQIIAVQNGTELEFKAGKPGIYRVESHLDGRPWILSNHIRILGSDGQE